jgi:hypothetical protein
MSENDNEMLKLAKVASSQLDFPPAANQQADRQPLSNH